jgi:hypothetical protein
MSELITDNIKIFTDSQDGNPLVVQFASDKRGLLSPCQPQSLKEDTLSLFSHSIKRVFDQALTQITHQMSTEFLAKLQKYKKNVPSIYNTTKRYLIKSGEWFNHQKPLLAARLDETTVEQKMLDLVKKHAPYPTHDIHKPVTFSYVPAPLKENVQDKLRRAGYAFHQNTDFVRSTVVVPVLEELTTLQEKLKTTKFSLENFDTQDLQNLGINKDFSLHYLTTKNKFCFSSPMVVDRANVNLDKASPDYYMDYRIFVAIEIPALKQFLPDTESAYLACEIILNVPEGRMAYVLTHTPYEHLRKFQSGVQAAAMFEQAFDEESMRSYCQKVNKAVIHSYNSRTNLNNLRIAGLKKKTKLLTRQPYLFENTEIGLRLPPTHKPFSPTDIDTATILHHKELKHD